MLLEIHTIRNFVPSNLNRDDTNAPKCCEFGGYRRARISSQAIKRAVRERFQQDALLDGAYRATRTRVLLEKRLVPELTRRGRDEQEARAVAKAALLTGLGLAVEGEEGKERTQYLLFVADSEIQKLVELCERYWNALQMSATSASVEESEVSTRERKRRAGSDLSQDIREELQRTFREALDGGKAADLALFGRMLADLPAANVDAACQVAHAISTHIVNPEFDFFTAVDDLQLAEEPGAGMMGTVEFNSACFYQYSNVDIQQLIENLKGDQDLARKSMQAFLRAWVQATPSGKQNSMAAHNPPSFILVRVRTSSWPWNLANAFVQPVRPERRVDLVQTSVHRMLTYLARLEKVYGAQDLAYQGWVSVDADLPDEFRSHAVETLDELWSNTLSTIFSQVD